MQRLRELLTYQQEEGSVREGVAVHANDNATSSPLSSSLLAFDEVDISGFPPSTTFTEVMRYNNGNNANISNSTNCATTDGVRKVVGSSEYTVVASMTATVETVSVGDRHQLKTRTLPIGARSLLLEKITHQHQQQQNNRDGVDYGGNKNKTKEVPPAAVASTLKKKSGKEKKGLSTLKPSASSSSSSSQFISTRRRIIFRGLNKFPALDEEGGRDVFHVATTISKSDEDGVSAAWGGATAGQLLSEGLLGLCSQLLSRSSTTTTPSPVSVFTPPPPSADTTTTTTQPSLYHLPMSIISQRKLGGFLVSLFSLDGKSLQIMSKHAIEGPHIQLATAILRSQVSTWLQTMGNHSKSTSNIDVGDQHRNVGADTEAALVELAKVLFERNATVLCECVDLLNDANHPILEPPTNTILTTTTFTRADDTAASIQQQTSPSASPLLQYLMPFAVQNRSSRVELALPALQAAEFVGRHLPFLRFVDQTVFTSSSAFSSSSMDITNHPHQHALEEFPAFLSKELLSGSVFSWHGGSTEGFVLTMECHHQPNNCVNNLIGDYSSSNSPSWSSSQWVRPFRLKLKTFRYRITRLLRSALLGELSTSGTDFWSQPAMVQVFVSWLRSMSTLGQLPLSQMTCTSEPSAHQSWWREVLSIFFKSMGLTEEGGVAVNQSVKRVVDATIAQLMPNMISFTTILRQAIIEDPRQDENSCNYETIRSPSVRLAMLCGLPGSGKTTLSGHIGSTFSQSSSPCSPDRTHCGASGNLIIHVERDHFFAAEQAKIKGQRFGAIAAADGSIGVQLTNRDMKLAQRRAHKAVVVACRRASNISLGLTMPTAPLSPSLQDDHYHTAVIVLDACNATIAARRHWRSEFPFQLNQNNILSNVSEKCNVVESYQKKPSNLLRFALVFLDVAEEDARRRAMRRTFHPVLPTLGGGGGTTVPPHKRMMEIQVITNAVTNVNKVFESPWVFSTTLSKGGGGGHHPEEVVDGMNGDDNSPLQSREDGSGVLIVRRTATKAHPPQQRVILTADDVAMANAPLLRALGSYWGMASGVSLPPLVPPLPSSSSPSLEDHQHTYYTSLLEPCLTWLRGREGHQQQLSPLSSSSTESSKQFSMCLESLNLFNKALPSLTALDGEGVVGVTPGAVAVRGFESLRGTLLREMCRARDEGPSAHNPLVQARQSGKNSSMVATTRPRRSLKTGASTTTTTTASTAPSGHDVVGGADDTFYGCDKDLYTDVANRCIDNDDDDEEIVADRDDLSKNNPRSDTGVVLGLKRPRSEEDNGGEGVVNRVPDEAALLKLDQHSHRRWMVYLDLSSCILSTTPNNSILSTSTTLLLDAALSILHKAACQPQQGCPLEVADYDNYSWAIRGNTNWIRGGLFDFKLLHAATTQTNTNTAPTTPPTLSLTGCLHPKIVPIVSSRDAHDDGEGDEGSKPIIPIHCTLSFYKGSSNGNSYRSLGGRGEKIEGVVGSGYAAAGGTLASSVVNERGTTLPNPLVLKLLCAILDPKCGVVLSSPHSKRGSSSSTSTSTDVALQLLLYSVEAGDIMQQDNRLSQGVYKWLLNTSKLPIFMQQQSMPSRRHVFNGGELQPFSQPVTMEVYAVAANQRVVLALVRKVQWGNAGAEVLNDEENETGFQYDDSFGDDGGASSSLHTNQQQQLPLHITLALRERETAYEAAVDLLTACGAVKTTTPPLTTTAVTQSAEEEEEPFPPSTPTSSTTTNASTTRKKYSHSHTYIPLREPLVISGAYLAVAML